MEPSGLTRVKGGDETPALIRVGGGHIMDQLIWNQVLWVVSLNWLRRIHIIYSSCDQRN